MQQQQYCSRLGVWQTRTVEGYESQQGCLDKCNVPLEEASLTSCSNKWCDNTPQALFTVLQCCLCTQHWALYPSSLLCTQTISCIKAVSYMTLKGFPPPVQLNTALTPNQRTILWKNDTVIYQTPWSRNCLNNCCSVCQEISKEFFPRRCY